MFLPIANYTSVACFYVVQNYTCRFINDSNEQIKVKSFCP